VKRAFEEQTYRSADGLALYYRDFPGPEAPVVCLPGVTRNSRDFEALARHLNSRHRILTPDLRGRGRSAWDPNWRNYHPGTYVGDVVALLEHAGIQRVVIVGTSLGGIVGMLFAAAHSDRLAGLVLNDIGPEVDPRGLARISSYIGALPPVTSWREAADQAREVYGAALPDFTPADWDRYARLGFRESEQGIPRLDLDPKVGEAARQASGAGPAPSLWPIWGSLRELPMLAIRGEHSDILSPATFERMAREQPALARATVANRGHAPTLDEPASREAIDRFLRGLV